MVKPYRGKVYFELKFLSYSFIDIMEGLLKKQKTGSFKVILKKR